MKTKNFITVRIVNRIIIFLLLSIVWLFPSCFDNDDVGDNYVTFTGEMMGEYLKKNPEKFSEFSKMLDTTGVMGLLNAYGVYTCFAPTNEAIQNFYAKRGHSSINDFPFDSIKLLVYNHLINGASVASSEFRNGRLSRVTMSGRYISTTPTINEKGLPVIYINETSLMESKDYEVHNGIVHTMGKVIEPTDLRLVEVIEKDKKFQLFYEALVATQLYKEIELVEDKTFVPDPDYKPVLGTGAWSATWYLEPTSRKYGYTALIESDSTFKVNGINNLDDLKAYAKQVYDQVYPDDADITDVTDRKNSLNRFVAYHLINKQLGYTKFVYDLDNTGVTQPNTSHSIKVYDMFEYIETMCPNTLMEVRTLRATNEPYGVFNMIQASGKGTRINKDYKDKDALNGVYHEIDNILAYSKEFVSELTTKRLRMDAASFFPELTNNNMRSSHLYQRWQIPKGYLERLTASDVTVFNYLLPDDRFMNYQGDEVFMSECLYDFTVVTPPIPAGVYEVRFGYLSNGKRGVAQLYWDGEPCGIPLNLNTPSSDPKIGYEAPGSNPIDPEGFENDKMMHNRGFMKGPASYTSILKDWRNEANGRMSPYCLRRVLGIFTFKEDGSHTFGAKAAKPGEFMFDYLEFVPKEAIDKEGID
jgi:uncharacterized surface protein with fasciclin (FAS1) repeats